MPAPCPGARLLPSMMAIALLATTPAALDATAATRTTNVNSDVLETAPVPVPAGGRTYRVTLKQLGALFPMQLRGVQGNSGVAFSIRNDEVVTAARLRLNYAYSPALINELSHIRVLLNEQVAATIPVPNEQGGMSLQREINIPPRLITEFNRLNLELIGHYTLDCEDPAHSSLWANVGNDSELELTVTPVPQVNDLALLPEPFFDRRDVRPLKLPIVFANVPNATQLEAAGALSSWFGSLAGFRRADFPASVGQIPAKGNAIVLALGNERPGGLELPAPKGPTVAVMANPNDATGKLLVITGRDTKEIKTAAAAVTVGSPALSGALATITELKALKPRKPYDAPNWLAGDRPVKFGELVEEQTLNVAGYSPDLIRINFHMPPDLFAWREKGIPVDLKYRYTARPTSDKSTLNINVNQQFLRSQPLLAVNHEQPNALNRLAAKVLPENDLLPAEDAFRIPLFKLPAQTQLQFHYYYEVIKQGPCKDVLLDNVRGTVEPDSTVDISGFSHFLAMPDLAAFSNSGFPFTRLADLSETAVIMPDKPAESDYSTFLSLMGLMGRVTGYPATSVTVAQAQQAHALRDKDLLVIGSSANQPLLTQWADALPFSLNGDSKRFQISDFAYRIFNWWDPDQRDRAKPRSSEVSFNSDSTDAVITGFESPLQSGRSVVVLASNQPMGLQQAVNALLDPDLVMGIQGSTTVIRGKQIDSLVAEQSYYVGHLNPLIYMQWFLSRNPLTLIVLGAASALLIALLLYLSLRARARARLKPKN